MQQLHPFSSSIAVCVWTISLTRLLVCSVFSLSVWCLDGRVLTSSVSESWERGLGDMLLETEPCYIARLALNIWISDFSLQLAWTILMHTTIPWLFCELLTIKILLSNMYLHLIFLLVSIFYLSGSVCHYTYISAVNWTQCPVFDRQLVKP